MCDDHSITPEYIQDLEDRLKAMTTSRDGMAAQIVKHDKENTLLREVLKHAGELLKNLSGTRHFDEDVLDDAEITADQIAHLLKG